ADGDRPARGGTPTRDFAQPVERDRAGETRDHGGHRAATGPLPEDIPAVLDAAAGGLGPARCDGPRGSQGVLTGWVHLRRTIVGFARRIRETVKSAQACEKLSPLLGRLPGDRLASNASKRALSRAGRCCAPFDDDVCTVESRLHRSTVTRSE